MRWVFTPQTPYLHLPGQTPRNLLRVLSAPRDPRPSGHSLGYLVSFTAFFRLHWKNGGPAQNIHWALHMGARPQLRQGWQHSPFSSRTWCGHVFETVGELFPGVVCGPQTQGNAQYRGLGSAHQELTAQGSGHTSW